MNIIVVYMLLAMGLYVYDITVMRFVVREIIRMRVNSNCRMKWN